MQQNSSAKTAAPHWLTSIKNIFLDALFPPKCLMCGHLFQSAATDPVSESAISQQRDVLFYAQRWLTALCCQSCLNAVAAISEPFCKHCGMMFNQPQADNALCSDCMMQPHKFRMARAAIAYDAQSMVMIQQFKYTGKTQLAGPFGALLLYTFLRYWHPESIDLTHFAGTPASPKIPAPRLQSSAFDARSMAKDVNSKNIGRFVQTPANGCVAEK